MALQYRVELRSIISCGNPAWLIRPACNSGQLLRHLLASHPTSTPRIPRICSQFLRFFSWLPWGTPLSTSHTLSISWRRSPFAFLAILDLNRSDSAKSAPRRRPRGPLCRTSSPFFCCHVSQRPVDVASVLVALYSPHPIIIQLFSWRFDHSIVYYAFVKAAWTAFPQRCDTNWCYFFIRLGRPDLRFHLHLRPARRLHPLPTALPLSHLHAFPTAK